MENLNMTNEEVVEVTEEIAKAYGKGRTLGNVAAGAAMVIVGGVTYKYVVKPAIKKIKTRRAEKKAAKEEIDEFERDMDGTSESND